MIGEITKDLTLNLGLAWDITNPIREVDGRMANYDPFVNQQFHCRSEWCYAVRRSTEELDGVSSRESAWPGKCSAATRLCFRAGYAIYHDSAWSMGAQGLWQNPPFLR